MEFLILLYGTILDFLEDNVKVVSGFCMGVLVFTVFLLVVKAHWVAAAIFVGLAGFNYYFNKK